jgi:hypothetical protein
VSTRGVPHEYPVLHQARQHGHRLADQSAHSRVPAPHRAGGRAHMGTIRRSQGYYEECSTCTLRVLTRPFAHLGADHGLIAARRNARELEGYSRGAWRLRARSARAARRGRGRTHGSAGRMRCRGTCGALTDSRQSRLVIMRLSTLSQCIEPGDPSATREVWSRAPNATPRHCTEMSAIGALSRLYTHTCRRALE